MVSNYATLRVIRSMAFKEDRQMNKPGECAKKDFHVLVNLEGRVFDPDLEYLEL